MTDSCRAAGRLAVFLILLSAFVVGALWDVSAWWATGLQAVGVVLAVLCVLALGKMALSDLVEDDNQEEST